MYRARQMDANREVALKLLHKTVAEDKERFMREFKSLARLSHEHIITFYGAAINEQAIPYAVCEYIRGKSLQAELQDSGAMNWERALNIALQLCDAMQHAHAHGVIHRDLKPANIMLLESASEDWSKILDFGFAKLMDTSQKLTRTGTLIGTTHYMSPEQCQGKTVDARSDIYSLACIIFEMLAGERLFDADNSIGLIHKHAYESPLPSLKKLRARNIPSALVELLERALAKDPAQRIQSMLQLRDDISKILQGEQLSKPQADLLRKSFPRRGVAIAAMGTVLLGALLLQFGIWKAADGNTRQLMKRNICYRNLKNTTNQLCSQYSEYDSSKLNLLKRAINQAQSFPDLSPNEKRDLIRARNLLILWSDESDARNMALEQLAVLEKYNNDDPFFLAAKLASYVRLTELSLNSKRATYYHDRIYNLIKTSKRRSLSQIRIVLSALYYDQLRDLHDTCSLKQNLEIVQDFYAHLNSDNYQADMGELYNDELYTSPQRLKFKCLNVMAKIAIQERDWSAAYNHLVDPINHSELEREDLAKVMHLAYVCQQLKKHDEAEVFEKQSRKICKDPSIAYDVNRFAEELVAIGDLNYACKLIRTQIPFERLQADSLLEICVAAGDLAFRCGQEALGREIYRKPWHLLPPLADANTREASWHNHWVFLLDRQTLLNTDESLPEIDMLSRYYHSPAFINDILLTALQRLPFSAQKLTLAQRLVKVISAQLSVSSDLSITMEIQHAKLALALTLVQGGQKDKGINMLESIASKTTWNNIFECQAATMLWRLGLQNEAKAQITRLTNKELATHTKAQTENKIIGFNATNLLNCAEASYLTGSRDTARGIWKMLASENQFLQNQIARSKAQCGLAEEAFKSIKNGRELSGSEIDDNVPPTLSLLEVLSADCIKDSGDPKTAMVLYKQAAQKLSPADHIILPNGFDARLYCLLILNNKEFSGKESASSGSK